MSSELRAYSDIECWPGAMPPCPVPGSPSSMRHNRSPTARSREQSSGNAGGSSGSWRACSARRSLSPYGRCGPRGSGPTFAPPALRITSPVARSNAEAVGSEAGQHLEGVRVGLGPCCRWQTKTRQFWQTEIRQFWRELVPPASVPGGRSKAQGVKFSVGIDTIWRRCPTGRTGRRALFGKDTGSTWRNACGRPRVPAGW